MKIIEIKKENIRMAAETLAHAFRQDPIFRYIFQTPEKYHRAAAWMFSTWIRWSILYGKAWMTEDGKTVLLTRKPGKCKMTLWSMIMAGMLPTPFKLGNAAFRRFYFRVVELLDKKNAEIMGSDPHWYGWMVGINKQSAHGAGKELIDYYLSLADETNLPVYIETEGKVHVRMYHRYAFELIDETEVVENLTIYYMKRMPREIRNEESNSVNYKTR